MKKGLVTLLALLLILIVSGCKTADNALKERKCIML